MHFPRSQLPLFRNATLTPINLPTHLGKNRGHPPFLR